MFVVMEQVFVLFAFSLAGYLLSVCKLANVSHAKLLSTLLVYVFLPCNIFRTFSVNCTVEYISEKYVLIIASAVIIALLVVFAKFGARLFSKEAYPQKIYRYALSIPNYGFMGFALTESLLGTAGLLNIMLFSLPISLYNYSGAFCMLTKKKLTLKSLLHPVLIAIALGMIVGLTGIPVPKVIISIMDKSSACMGPVSMLLAGITISEFQVPALLKNKKNYIIVFLRLILIPGILGLLLLPLNNPVLLQSAVLLYAMPCGLNTIVYPKLVDEDCEIGAGMALVSNVLACLTIPLMCALFGIQ